MIKMVKIVYISFSKVFSHIYTMFLNRSVTNNYVVSKLSDRNRIVFYYEFCDLRALENNN